MAQRSPKAKSEQGIASDVNSEPRGDGQIEAVESEKLPTEPPVLSAAEEDEAGKVYPPTREVIPVMVAIFLALFLVSLDRTIIATAVPRMTDAFHSVGDIGWYSSAYMLTGCAFQLFYGRIYTFYSPKWVFLSSVTMFELGSLICGVSPSSVVFIIGRAVAGVGSAGIFSGSIILTVHIVPLRLRPTYQGFMGGVLLVSAIIGPLLGGAFTTKLSWRWCFYINLPCGGLSIILTILFLGLPNTHWPGGAGINDPEVKLSLRSKIERLDPVGTFFFLPGVICLLIALQWGGSTYPWNDTRIISLLALSGFLMTGFGIVQVWKQENATLPPRILRYRSVTAASFFAFCISGAMTVIVYFLPTWFQAIQGVDAVQSGIRTLPLIISMLLASITSGGLTTKIGYYAPFLIGCSVIMAIGGGLMSTFKVNSSKVVWIGFQVVFGFGTGLGQQQAGLAAQTVLPSKDVSTGVALKFFGQSLGGAIFAVVGQSVLSNKLVHNLTGIPGLMESLPHFDPRQIVNLGALQLREFFGAKSAGAVMRAFNSALDSVFQLGMILSCLSLVGALLVEWKSIKGITVQKGSGGA